MRKSFFPLDKWFPLGLQLGLLSPTLKVIETDHKHSVERRLQECLTCWLSRADKVDEYGGPTLESLARALKEIGEVSTANNVIKSLSEKTHRHLQFKIVYFQTETCKMLQKCFDELMPDPIPMEVPKLLCTEGIISKETFHEVESSGGSLPNSPLRVLFTKLSEDPSILGVLARVLSQSENTIRVAKYILKVYGEQFKLKEM